jgi:glycerophosphoryl diester phosphodiesterase
VGVVPWTVNRGRALRRLAALGVDGFITDVPRAARLALAVDARAAA